MLVGTCRSAVAAAQPSPCTAVSCHAGGHDGAHGSTAMAAHVHEKRTVKAASPHGVVANKAGNEGSRLLHIEQLAGGCRVGGQQAPKAQCCRGGIGCPAAGRRQEVLCGAECGDAMVACGATVAWEFETMLATTAAPDPARMCGQTHAAPHSAPAAAAPHCLPAALVAGRRRCCSCRCCCAAAGRAAAGPRHASPPAPAGPALPPGPAPGSWALVAARTRFGCTAAPPGPALR